MGRCSQLKALIWKNFLLQNRPMKKALIYFGSLLTVSTALLLARSMTPRGVRRNRIHKPVIIGPPTDPIIYVPKTAATDALMENSNDYCKLFHSGCQMEGFHTVEEALLHVNSSRRRRDTPLIDLRLDMLSGEVPKDMRVVLHIARVARDSNIVFEPAPMLAGQLTGHNILQVMALITNNFVTYWSINQTHQAPTPFLLSAVKMPDRGRSSDLITKLMNTWMPFLFSLVFMLTGAFICKDICVEKNNKLKGSVKLMGVPGCIYWLGWFLSGILFLHLPAVTLLVAIIYPTYNGPYFEHTSYLLLYIFLTLFSIDVVCFIFVVSCLIKTDEYAAELFLLLYLIAHIASNFASNHLSNYHPTLYMIQGSLLFTQGYTETFKAFAEAELQGWNYNFDNLQQPLPKVPWSPAQCMITLVANIFVLLVVFWYLDNVFPGKTGIRKPFLFCFTKRYWCPGSDDESWVDHGSDSQGEDWDDVYNKDESTSTPRIMLKNVSKKFGTTVAVQNMTLNIYHDQITVLFGHNGAGKSTTLTMVAGLVSPTAGTITVNGYDVRTNPRRALQNVGFCPQNDILFDQLTTIEHMKFYSWLRGVSANTAEMEEYLSAVGLRAMMGTFACHLSGGQKRKLSVASAVVGNTQIIILDEPATGLDPMARQELWTFLRRLRAYRTILMTTNFMDEMELLADRIAIIHTGVLKCSGSAKYLKKLYGTGYRLSVTMNRSRYLDLVIDFIRTEIPTATLLDSSDTQFAFLLPINYQFRFAPLLRALEKDSKKFGIENVGMSATTLEEVFIRVSRGVPVEEEEEEEKEVEREGSQTSTIPFSLCPTEGNSVDMSMNAASSVLESTTDRPVVLPSETRYEPNIRFRRTVQQFVAIFKKKAIFTKRHWKVQVLLIVAASILMISIAIHASHRQPDYSLLWLSLKQLQRGVTLVFFGEHLPGYLARYQEQVGPPNKLEIVSETKYENLSEYLLEKVMPGETANSVYAAACFNVTDSWIKGFAYYSPDSGKGLGISTQLVLNTYVRKQLGQNFSISTAIGAAVMTSKTTRIVRAFNDMWNAFVLIMPMLPGLFAHILIYERKTGAAHLQKICGVTPFTYWLPALIWDVLLYMVILFCALVTLMQEPGLILTKDGWAMTILILYCYGLGMVAHTYVFQRLFTSVADGICWITVFNVLMGMVLVTLTRSLGHASYSMNRNNEGLSFLETVFSIVSPVYNLHVCLFSFGKVTVLLEAEGTFIEHFHFPKFRTAMIILCAQFFVYSATLVLIELQISRVFWYGCFAENEDVSIVRRLGIVAQDSFDDYDVEMENCRIRNSQKEELFKTDAVLLRNLCKVYDTKVAVDRICLGVQGNDCLGLLGHNGAGKTTTFKLLSGDIFASGGDAFVWGNSIRTDLKQIHALIGYCPQVNALHKELTGRETLFLYGRLRGIPESHLRRETDLLLDALPLVPNADGQIESYSYGIKRRLSIAIALIGSPPLILLDEPFHGLDPMATRDVMRLLRQALKRDATVFLTSNSLDQCEWLCTKLVFMVAGQMRCLGTTQSLKEKFAKTLTVILKEKTFGTPGSDTLMVQRLREAFPGCQLYDKHEGRINIQVPEESKNLSQIFAEMENIKVDFDLEEYLVYKTTLDQVFFNVCKHDCAQSISHSGFFC